MTTVRREPLAEQAAALLLARIQRGEWSLGQKLPGETTLGPQLGVGRSTIREAIRQLAGRGVLSTRQGSGVFVERLDVAEEWHQVIGRADIAAVIEARVAIEVEAAALAAQRHTPGDLRSIRRAAESRSANRSDLEQHVDADTAFHRSIVAAARNPILTELFDSFTPRSRQAMIALLRLGGEYGSDADQHTHAEILEAIAARDAVLAAARSREHLLQLRSRLGGAADD